MKILHIGKFYPPVYGGIETVTRDLVEETNKRNIRCDVLCSNIENEYVEDIITGYKVIRTKTIRIIFSTPISWHLIKKLKDIQDDYDIIHIHFPNPLAALAVFCARPKAKIVIHWHSDIIHQKILLKFYSVLQNWIIRKASLIIGPTESHIFESDYASYIKSKGVIIPFIFNEKSMLEKMDENDLDILKKKYEGKKIIFSVGRLVYYKGYDYLINSAKYLPDDYMILIAGDGEKKKNLEFLIRKYNLEKKVKLLGRISQKELVSYYELSDIYCLSSVFRSEMFGMVQLEAMFFGKPIVSTNIERSGVNHVNIDGITGLVVPPRNSNALADAFMKIIEDVDLYQKMSNNAKKVLSEKYNTGEIMKQLISAYRGL